MLLILSSGFGKLATAAKKSIVTPPHPTTMRSSGGGEIDDDGDEDDIFAFRENETWDWNLQLQTGESRGLVNCGNTNVLREIISV